MLTPVFCTHCSFTLFCSLSSWICCVVVTGAHLCVLFCTSETLRLSKSVKKTKDDVYFWFKLYDLFLQNILKTSSNSVYTCKLCIIERALLDVAKWKGKKKSSKIVYMLLLKHSSPLCLYLLFFKNRNLLVQEYVWLYAGIRDLQFLRKVQKDITDK